MNSVPIWAYLTAGASIAALITGIIALVNVSRQKRVEFTYDYRKYFLEKRKAAYDDVEMFLHQLGERRVTNKGRVPTFFRPTRSNPHPLGEFNVQMIRVIKSRYWFSDEIDTLIRRVYRNIKIDLKFLAERNNDSEIYFQRGIERLPVYKDLFFKMNTQYFLDLIKLDRVEEFARKKSGIRPWYDIRPGIRNFQTEAWEWI
jgi:hypothetical protein